MTLSFENAMKLLHEAVRLAAQENHHIAAAVVDTGGNLVAFGRSDNAQLVTIDTAIGKAYTAIAIGAPSSVLHAASQPGQPLAGFQAMTMHPHPLVPFAGGVLVKEGDTTVAALGVSGAATSETDEQIANKAIEVSKKPRA